MSDLADLLEDEEPTSPFWMATFSDMMTLLLAFFVMLVAMSTVEVKKFEEAMSYFTGQRGLMTEQGLMPGVQAVVSEHDVREVADRYEQIVQAVQEKGLGEAVSVDLTAQGVRVTFVDSIAFASGSAALDGPAQDVLVTVAELAASAEGVEVEGHTDDRPIATGAYPSNWELSAARAAAVVRFLSAQPDALPPSAHAAVGYGEHRPRTDNDTPEGRARNRRISVLFRTPDADAPPTQRFPTDVR